MNEKYLWFILRRLLGDAQRGSEQRSTYSKADSSLRFPDLWIFTHPETFSREEIYDKCVWSTQLPILP